MKREHFTDLDIDALERCQARPNALVLFVEWLADQPCKGNGSGKLCRINAPHDHQWCCAPCRAHLLRYNVPAKVVDK